MLVGYMRVSSEGDRQVMDLQRDALLAAGVDERLCSKITPVAIEVTAPVLPRHWLSSAAAIVWWCGSSIALVGHCRISWRR